VNPPSSEASRIERALLIVNPGARLAGRAQRKAVAAFERDGVQCDVFVTKAPGHATSAARERASAYDALFTLGGDGTAMEVITALANPTDGVPNGPPIGILPGGTGNVLVRALGIPMRITKAVRALVRGAEARIDLGRVSDGRHFAIGLGVGLDEAMIAATSPLMKRRFGYLAYVWSATKATLRLQRFRVRLTVDGVVHERDAAFVLIANVGGVPLLGSVLRLGERILHDDGVLHACVFSPRNFREAASIMVGLLRGTVTKHPRAFYASGRNFRLETDPPRRAQADGELLTLTPIEVTVRPLAARLLIPAQRDQRSF
jgi:diacylglycerol kinase (ATP)